MSLRLLALVSLVLISVPAVAAERDDDRFVLTISGGISLGAYDSGRNWVVLRDLHQRRSRSVPSAPSPLGAITGASAGAINAFISALDWCTAGGVPGGNTVSRNPYRKMWTSITFEKLLPPAARGLGVDNALYADDASRNAHRDGLLARSNADREIMALLRSWYQGDGVTFVPGCKVPLGFTVTRERPRQEPLFGDLIAFPQQTYYVALVLAVGENGRPHLYHDETVYDQSARLEHTVTFGDRSHHFDGALLRLPACGGTPGSDAICHAEHSPSRSSEISFEQLVGVLYASSAVPVAFGRVFLDYCQKTDGALQARGCPAGSKIDTDAFIDGGVFDNVPIGLGLALADRDSSAGYLRFFYIDSDILVKDLSPTLGAQGSTALDYRLPSQLAFLGGTVQTARAASRVRPITDLCDRERDDCDGRAVIAQRSGRITGEMLGAFGAFIDERFAEYDYALGVADGLRTIARDGETPLVAAERLGIDENTTEWHQIVWLLAGVPNPDPAVERDFAAIDEALEHANAEFATFTERLGDAGFKAEGNTLLRRALYGADDWFMPIAARATDRLRYLEFHGDDEPGALGATMGVVDNYVKLNTQVPGWDLWTTVNEKAWWAPPQIGWEMIRGSAEIAWRPTWSGRKIQVEVPIGILASVGGDSVSDVQAQLGMNLRFPPVMNGIGRLGFGPRAYYDLDPSGRTDRFYGGGAVFFDAFSAVRFELSYRDSPWDDYWFVTVSAYDLPSVVRLFVAN